MSPYLPVTPSEISTAATEAGIPRRALASEVAEVAGDAWGGKLGSFVINHLSLAAPPQGKDDAEG